MLCCDSKKRSLNLVEFDLESAIAFLKSGQPVIPVWLDQIHQGVAIAVLKKVRYGGESYAYALCPMPYALCPMPARAPHVTEKGYSKLVS